MFNKITALYCRYSRDDGQEEENASITHQRKLLKEYAEITDTLIFAVMLMTDTAVQISTDLTFSVCLKILKTG